MFFDPERIEAVREMILAENAKQRAAALAKILPMQRDDFVGILREMAGLPVTIRLLDPPLHEFLPKEDAEIADLAAKIGVTPDHLKQVRDSLFEFNPMLGHRGSRLGISYPEIYKAQARAILEAACELRKKGVKAIPEIMLPLIGDRKEFDVLAGEIREVANEVFAETGAKVAFTIGTMIEVPRACIVAGEIAESAEFFSFGTNDLTQMTYGLSRDDSVEVPQRLHRARNLQEGPVPGTRRERRRRPDANRDRARTQGQQEAQDRHLRRARRRPRERQALPSPGPRLRIVLAVPAAGRAPGGGTGGDRSGPQKESLQGRVGGRHASPSRRFILANMERFRPRGMTR